MRLGTRFGRIRNAATAPRAASWLAGSGAVAPVSGTEPAGAIDALGFEDGPAVVPLLHECVAQVHAVLGFDRAAVGSGAELGELGDLVSELFGACSRLTVGDDVLTEPDA